MILKDQTTPDETSPQEPNPNLPLLDQEKQSSNIKSEQENLETLKDWKLQTTKERPLKTLRNSILPSIFQRWYSTGVFDIAL